MTSSSQTTQSYIVAEQSKQLFNSKKYKQIAIVGIPREQYVLVLTGTAITIDIYLEIIENPKLKKVTAEACDFPFTFEMVQNLGDIFRTKMYIDPLQSDVVQLKKFEDLAMKFHQHNKFEIFASSGKKVLSAEGAQIDEFDLSGNWYSAVSDLAFIQTKTSQRIPAPKIPILYPKDFRAIEKIKTIIESGELIIQNLERVTFTTSKEMVRKLIELQKVDGKIKMKLCIDQSSEKLLDTEVHLGPATYELPEMKLKYSLETIKSEMEKSDVNSQMEITVVPHSLTEAKLIYSNWQKS